MEKDCAKSLSVYELLSPAPVPSLTAMNTSATFADLERLTSPSSAASAAPSLLKPLWDECSVCGSTSMDQA